MRLWNKPLIVVGCALFSLHFILLMLVLGVCYFFKALYCKAKGRESFKINPYSHAHPEVMQPTMTVLTIEGFRIDTYKFLTGDNCTLSCWRVVNLNKAVTKPHPVILQHGLLDCSVSWFLQQDKTKGLPYLLANLGFDVWLGNNRGTKFSNEEQDRKGYWDYSFDELAKYDLPTFINGVLAETKAQKVIYIGHSQGSSQFLAHLTDEEEAISGRIQAFIALGPVISLKNVKDHPVINLAAKIPVLQFYSFLGFKTFLVLPMWLSRCVGVLIYNVKFYLSAFLHVVNILCGYPVTNKIDIDRFGIMIAHEPGGASINNLKHWIQLTKTEHFRKFDYGQRRNRELYGCDQPPSYNFDRLKQFCFNKYIFRGAKDAVISDKDFSLLVSKLEPLSTFSVTIEDYAHLDYLWGTCASGILYQQILEIALKESQ